MARINIEDSIYKDIRFINLILKLGSVDTALGALVRAWSLAQKHYLDEAQNRLIPVDEWKQQSISDEIINCGLAVKNDCGIYVEGSREQFGWLLQKQSAGKKSAEARLSTVEHPLNSVERASTSSSSSSSFLLSPSSNSNSNSNSNSVSKSIVPTDKKSVKTSKAESPKLLIKIESPKQLAELLDQKNKNLLFQLYNDPEYIKREFFKIQNWLDRNPRKNNKTKRGWLGFVSTWLDSGWAKHQQNIPANQAKASSVDELMSMMGWS